MHFILVHIAPIHTCDIGKLLFANITQFYMQLHMSLSIHSVHAGECVFISIWLLISVKICCITIQSHELCEMCVTCNVIIKYWNHSVLYTYMWIDDDDMMTTRTIRRCQNTSSNGQQQRRTEHTEKKTEMKFIATKGKNGYQLML